MPMDVRVSRFVKSVIFVVSLAAFSPWLFAASQFDDDLVPLELVQEFVGGLPLKGLPEGFPVVSLPEAPAYRLIGGLDNFIEKRVYLSFAGDLNVVISNISQAYRQQGWLEILSFETGTQSGSGSLIGLTSSAQPILAMLCNDNFGTLTLHQNKVPGAEVHVQVVFLPAVSSGMGTVSRLSCEEMQAAMNPLPGNSLTDWRQVSTIAPVLEIPEQAELLLRSGLPRFSSFVRNFSSLRFLPLSVQAIGVGERLKIVMDATLTLSDFNNSKLHGHFALQLEAQGWRLDTSVMGENTALSIWERRTELMSSDSGTVYLRSTATLSTVEISDNTYHLGFSIIPMPE